MDRRGFLKLLAGGAAVAAAPAAVVRAAELVVEPEPVRRYWQVGAQIGGMQSGAGITVLQWHTFDGTATVSYLWEDLKEGIARMADFKADPHTSYMHPEAIAALEQDLAKLRPAENDHPEPCPRGSDAFRVAMQRRRENMAARAERMSRIYD